MKCEFVKIGMLSVQIEDAGDGRAQKWHAQPKAGTKDDGIKFFQTFIAESNAPAPDFADPGPDGNPALSDQRQEVLAQRSSNSHEITGRAERTELLRTAKHPQDIVLHFFTEDFLWSHLRVKRCKAGKRERVARYPSYQLLHDVTLAAEGRDCAQGAKHCKVTRYFQCANGATDYEHSLAAETVWILIFKTVEHATRTGK